MGGEVSRYIQETVNGNNSLHLLFLYPQMSLDTILHVVAMLIFQKKNENMILSFPILETFNGFQLLSIKIDKDSIEP